MKLTEKVRNILFKLNGATDVLNSSNYKAYIVGGACRDFLLGKEPHDFDIATSAEPWEIKNIFPEAVTGGNNFLVSFVYGIEVASFRKDRSDHAEVAKTLKEDVERRDFTINGIAYFPPDRYGDGFIDYVGGVADIKNRVLKFIGEPEKRIAEDPVRIIRGIRFAAAYNLSIEKETYLEMFRLRDLVEDIPKERILLEVIKAFKTNNTHRFLTLLEEMDILKYVFPSLVRLRSIDGGGYHKEQVLSHCFNAVKVIEEKDYRLKLASLYHDCGKYDPTINDKGFNTFKDHNVKGMDVMVNDFKNYLKAPNELVDYIKYMCLHHMDYLALESDRNIKRFYTRLLEHNIPLKDFMYLRYADSRSNASKKTDFKSIKQMYKRVLKVIKSKPPFSIKDLNINGEEIMKLLNIKPSKLIGEILRNVFDNVQEDLLKNEKDAIIKFISDKYKGSK